MAPTRNVAIECVKDMVRDGANRFSKNNLKSGDLFAQVEEDFNPYEKFKDLPKLKLTEKLEFEKKSLGYYLSGHPVLAIENKIKNLRTLPIEQVTNDTQKASLVCLINNVRQIKDRKGKPLMFINFSDGTGSMLSLIHI